MTWARASRFFLDGNGTFTHTEQAVKKLSGQKPNSTGWISETDGVQTDNNTFILPGTKEWVGLMLNLLLEGLNKTWREIKVTAEGLKSDTSTAEHSERNQIQERNLDKGFVCVDGLKLKFFY